MNQGSRLLVLFVQCLCDTRKVAREKNHTNPLRYGVPLCSYMDAGMVQLHPVGLAPDKHISPPSRQNRLLGALIPPIHDNPNRKENEQTLHPTRPKLPRHRFSVHV